MMEEDDSIVCMLKSVGINDDGSASFLLRFEDDGEMIHTVSSDGWKGFLNGIVHETGMKFNGFPLVPDKEVYFRLQITESSAVHVDADITWVTIGDPEVGWTSGTFS